MEPKELLSALVRRNCIDVHYKEEWTGEYPNRKCQPTEFISGVTIRLTAAEWVSLCTRDGEQYVGGCCGNASHIQDLLNDIFRNDGHMASHTLIQFAQACMDHDGGESFEKLSENAEKTLELWWQDQENHGYEKFALVWHAVKEKLIGDSRVRSDKRRKPKDENELISRLRNALILISWHNLFEKREDNSGQERGNHAVAMARLLELAEPLNELVQKLKETNFDGDTVAIVDEEDEIVSNGYGACIYTNSTFAQDILKSWENGAKNDEEREALKKFKIISLKVKDGKLILGGAQ